MKNIIRKIIRQEEGVTIIMVLAFMALSVPIVTAALGLASTLSIDSRVKGDIAKNQFSNLGANDLVIQRLTEDVLPGPDGNGIPDILEDDDNGFEDGDGIPDIWEDADGDGEPDGYQETIDLNDDPIDIDITPELPSPLEAPWGEGLVVTKTIIDQSKTPMPAYDTPTNWVHYEIKIENVNDAGTEGIKLLRVFDGLPPGFLYEGVTKLNGVPIKKPEVVNALDLDPAEIQLLFDEGQPWIGTPRAMLTWHILDEKKFEVIINPYEFVLLTFKAKIPGSGVIGDGNYCNYAWTEPEGYPAGVGSRSGSTAILKIGEPAGDDCTAAQVHVTSTAVAELNPDEMPFDPNDDVLVTYSIIIDNGGTTDLDLWWLRNKLPPGFSYKFNSASGSLTSANPDLTSVGGVRQVAGWFFLPVRATILAGTQSTLTFQATAPRAAGLYRNEVWAFFDEFPDDESPYSWPSAAVYLADVFDVKINGESTVKVWLVDGTAVIR